jgi:hypothetical protein
MVQVWLTRRQAGELLVRWESYEICLWSQSNVNQSTAVDVLAWDLKLQQNECWTSCCDESHCAWNDIDSKGGKTARMAYIALVQVIVTNLFALLIPAGGSWSWANSLLFEVSLHDIESICFYSIDGNAHSINSYYLGQQTQKVGFGNHADHTLMNCSVAMLLIQDEKCPRTSSADESTRHKYCKYCLYNYTQLVKYHWHIVDKSVMSNMTNRQMIPLNGTWQNCIGKIDLPGFLRIFQVYPHQCIGG